jgi:TonB family protein
MTIRFSARLRCLLALSLLQPALAGLARAQILQNTTQAQLQGTIAEFGSAPPPPAASPEATPGGDYLPAKILTRPQVAYPTLADLNRVEGVVTIRFYIDETGHVTKTAVAKNDSSPLLSQLNGDPRLLQWTFQPATLNGKPVPSTHDQEFEFHLDPAEQKKLALHRLALPVGIPDPPYPPAAAANHLQGNVTVAVRWTKLGLVDGITLVNSSGVPYLDATALRFAYENWRVDPAVTDFSQSFVKIVRFAPPK